MASRRSTYEIAGLIFVTIILIVLLVLVGITFSKVNEKPSPSSPETTPSEPSSSSSSTTSKPPEVYHYDYSGNMDTQQTWDDDLMDPDTKDYKTNVTKYTTDITASLEGTYPGVEVTVNGFKENPEVAQLLRKTNGKLEDPSTVTVLFATVIPTDDSEAPTAESITNTINTNINSSGCNGCEATGVELQTTTARPTTAGPTTVEHTETTVKRTGTTVKRTGTTVKHTKTTGRQTKTTGRHTKTTGRHTVTTERQHLPGEYVAAEYLLSNMDERYHPCEDFYKFACGNFTKNHKSRDGAVGYGTFDLVQDRISDIIFANLQKINITSSTNLPAWKVKVKGFYDSCKSREQRGLKGNRKLLDYIDMLGGWPMIMEKGTWDEKKFNLPAVLAQLTSMFGVQTLVSSSVDLDWKNGDRFIIQLDQASLALGNPEYYLHARFAEDRQAYEEMIRQSASILTFDMDRPQDDERVKIASKEIMDFETLLANHVVTEDNRQNYTKMYNPEELQTIQSTYKFMNWQTYFTTLLPDSVKKPYEGTTNVVEPNFLLFLDDLMNKTAKKETVANYLIWRLVYSLNPFMDDNLSGTFRRFRESSRHITAELPRERDDECITVILDNLGFMASRLLINGSVQENEDNADAVLNMTAGLYKAFKEQLDNLFWMDDTTREIAKSKLNDYVELAGFPHWLLNDDKMDLYFKEFNVTVDRDFLENYVQSLTFHEQVQFRMLANKDSADMKRHTWIMPPAIVNAWYQPDFNSITFPAGILRPPFFRHDFPQAVNYGSLGTVIGHEMTHGFDDQGIQFNGTGYLDVWMSLHSRIGFKRMVGCVIRQYDKTCFPEVDMCIDGVQTQGENTADNGGIREAFSAYQAYVKEHGPEKRLPGLEKYTMDQIFFISFANVWCGDYETKEYLEKQLVTNVHSPPPARVMNTLKNFADFGRTFECEAGQPYYPFRSEVCYVWDSPKIANKTAYTESAEYMLGNMNMTVGPCEDFFEHVCGNFIKNYPPPEGASSFISINIIQDKVYREIIEKLDTLPSNESDFLSSIQKAKTYYDVCRHANDTEKKDNAEILGTLADLGYWPAINTTWKAPTTEPTQYFSKLVGDLSSMLGIQTLLVASATVDPGDTSRSVLAIDQSSLALGAREYYLEDKLQTVYDAYIDLITNVTMILSISNKHPITHQQATEAAYAIAGFEKNLAIRTRPDTDRRNFTLLYNLYNVSEASTDFKEVNWQTYLDALVSFSQPLKTYFNNPSAQIVISEPEFIHVLGKYLASEETDVETVQNYLLWRFIYARLNFMDDDVKEMYAQFRRVKQDDKVLPLSPTDCVDQLANMLGYTVGRLYVDIWDKRDGWRDDAAEMIMNITDAFDETIPQLDWMNTRSQEGAKTKVNSLVKNPAFPDWIKNDTILNEYYASYTVKSDSTFFDAFNQLNQFAMAKAFEAITEPVRRRDFQMSPAIVNAWYNPTLNSLTVPAAFLNPPAYHPEYPTAVKYGAIGAVMGHELTHAFDDSGIQFDGDGFLDLWMTQYSRDSYDKNVVDCVVNQYDHYCHFDGEFCNNGYRTQGENIADNGGIRQAFRAYRNKVRNEIRLNKHEELLLPGMEWYTEDQLFFISYANLWCGYYSDEYVRRELLTDVHSPGMDRVKGVVSNFDEFDKAFHCEVGEPMNPKDKCYVWTNPIDTTDGYDEAAKALLESLDPTTDPCDDFFQYACGGWINRHPIPKHASTISTNSLSEDAVLAATTYGIQSVDSTDPSALQKSKQMFDFCAKDISDSNSTSLASFEEYVNAELYEWPIITKFWVPTLNASQQVFNVAGKLGGMGLSTIFTAYPQPEFKPISDEDRHYALFIDQATLLLGNREIYLEDTFADVMKEYRDILIYVAVKFAHQFNNDVPIERIHSDVDSIIDFETTLARISLPASLQENYTAMYNPMTLTALKTEYKNIDWESYLANLLPEDIIKQKDDFKIVVSEPSYLKGLNDNLPYVDARVIQNYLVWRYTIDSASLLGSDMKARLLKFKQKTEFIEDFRDDVSTCTNDVINLLPYAAGRIYVDQAFGGDRRKIELKATELVRVGVVEQFRQRLRRLDWLDVRSLIHAEEKLNNLTINIGFPDITFNDKELDKLYQNLTITTKDYYTTKREVSMWMYQGRFMALDQNVDVRQQNFQMSPAIQNAWYQPWLNSLTIPAGEIQIPFFRLDYPSAVNFGGLGAVAGHELTHGFDDDGVQFGPTGDLDYWIDASSAAYFQTNISQCVVDQYDQYCYTDLPSGKLCINGKVTQGENIADNGGTKTAYNGYLEWVERNGYEALLPGLQDFTMDQIFFLNFAQSWCGAIKPEALEKQLLLDVHSPYRDRVIGTLSNMKEFHNSFHCRPGDKMVPEHTCDVW